MTDKQAKATTREQALRVARMLGCQGAHEQGDGWMPCGSPEEYVAIKKGEEEYLKVRASRKKKPQPTIVQRTKRLETKSDAYYENRADALAVSRSRGCNGVRTVILAGKKYYAVCEPKKPKNGWENLTEKPITGIATLPNGGLVTGSFSGKSLGPRIGDIGEFFEGSEFDGDGDGFRQGRDGKDNVPVVANTVANAVKNAGKVADILKATDDLAEVRKSGRPWKPLLFEYLPPEMQKEFKTLYNDVASRMNRNGSEWRKVEAELGKKYAKEGQQIFRDGRLTEDAYKLIPKEEIEKHLEIFNQYLLDGANGEKYQKNIDLAERIYEYDLKYHQYVQDAFKREREKAVALGNGSKFDNSFSKFKKAINDRSNFQFALRMIQGDYVNAPMGRAWVMGYEGKKWEDQFSIAEKEAKKLVNNPDKRVVSFVDAAMLDSILSDGKIKNFFEAKKNVFDAAFDEMAKYDKWGANERRKYYLASRLFGEQDLFGFPVGGFASKHRPVYALLMPDGMRATKLKNGDAFDYGNVGVVMKHTVEERSRFTGGDSLNFRFEGAPPINDPSWMAMISRKSLAMTADKRREGAKVLDGSNYDYIEAQIMGGVSVSDISYVTVQNDSVLSEEINTRLKEMGIPVVIHDSTDIYKESPELASKAEPKNDDYVLLATYGNRKLFVPNQQPEEGDMHGMITVDGGKRQRVDNIPALMKFGNWEFVGTGDTDAESTDDVDSEKSLEEKGFVNFVSRSTDPDVFSNPESARIRARNLGCIGIRRYTAGDGKTVWLPCTNVSDFNRLSGIRGDNSPIDNPRRRGSANRKKSSFDNGLISFKGVPKAKKKPPALNSDDINNLAVRVRQHNAKSTTESKTNLRDLKIVYIRGLLDDGRKEADKRVSKFLSLLNSEKPKDLKYSEDNDLLPLEHPWRNRKTGKKFAGFTEGEYGVKYSSGCCPDVVKRYRAK
jgi:hypothetical protein